MGIEQASPFSNSTSGGYYTRDSAESSITSATSSLVSGRIFADQDPIENNKPIMGVTVVDDYGSTQGTGSITVTSYLNLYPVASAAAATDALAITGGTVYHNDAFTVLVPEDAGGYAGDVTATIMARNSMGSTPSANQIHWYLDPSGDAAKIANLKLAINGTTDTSKVKFGSSFTNTLGVKGLTASNGTASIETYATLTADNTGINGNDIALTDTVGTVLVNESALASGKLAGGVDGGTHQIVLTAADGGYTNLLVASTTTTTDSEFGAFAEFQVATSNAVTATNLKTAINGLDRYDAEIDSVDNTKINITQSVGGSSGNTTIALTDPLGAGMTAVNFTGGIDPDLKLQGSHNGIDWVDITILDSTFPGSTGVHSYYPDLTNTYVPFWRMICNSTGLSVGTSGTSKFFYLYK